MALAPLNTRSWNRPAAAHLLSRAGFGATISELDACAKQTLPDALNGLLAFTGSPPAVENPSWAQPDPEYAQLRRQMRNMAEEERKEKQRELRQKEIRQIFDLRSWWLERMLRGPAPLQEKLALFWHGHFATSMEKVRRSYFMWKQNDLFRRHAAGNFRQLVLEAGRDPAMLVWLDGNTSRSGAPNENYARELMELFTLGEGHYTEEDIRESARAFTGWSIRPETQDSFFAQRRHDGGTKKFFGHSGEFGDQDIVELILKTDQCPRHLAAKLWTFFAYENPEAEIVDALAATLRKNDFELRPVLLEMFGSEAFYSPRAVQTQIKSPVSWLMELYKTLEMEQLPGPLAAALLQALGQNLFAPPSVKGWDGGRTWISASTLLLRNNAAYLLVHGGDVSSLGGMDNLRRLQRLQREEGDGPLAMAPGGPGAPGGGLRRRMPPACQPQRLIPPAERSGLETVADRILARFYPVAVAAGVREAVLRQGREKNTAFQTDEGVRELVQAALSHPQYQLC